MLSYIKKILFPKRICGKKWIDETMTQKYGHDWLDQALLELSDPDYCKEINSILDLARKYKTTK